MLRIKDEPLYRYDVTLLAVSIEGQADEWVFLPFDTEQAHFYPVVPDRLLAFADSGAMRLFDVPTRTCLLDAPASPAGRYSYLQPWAWSEARSSIITCYRLDGGSGVAIRELTIGPSDDRSLTLPRFYNIKALAARPEGDVIIFGDIEGDFCVGRVDLERKQVEIRKAPEIPTRRYAQGFCEPYRPSPNGRYILRKKLDAVLRDDPATRRRFDPLRSAPDHPDLVGSACKRYGIGLDVYRTWPFERVHRLVLRWISEEEYREGQRYMPGGQDIDFEALDRLADASERRRGPMSDAQFLCTIPDKQGRSFGPPELRETFTDADRAAIDAERPGLFLQFYCRKIEWDADSNGFTAHFGDGKTRHCSLDGRVGPLLERPPITERMISRKQREPVVRALRQRTSRKIKLPDLETPSLVAGLGRIADEMEKGMSGLIVNGVLGWEFAVGRQTIPESAFHARVLAAPAADHPLLLKPLQAIFQAYADQIGSIEIRAEQLYSLEQAPDDSDTVRATLAEAAVSFATLDPEAYRLLKAWFATVDSEHDPETVERVFSAIAVRTGFRTTDLVAFGLWFERLMVQSWAGTPPMATLLASARKLLTPADFALTAFSGALADLDARNAPPLDMQVDRILRLLETDDSEWAAEAAGLLDRFHRQHRAAKETA